MNSFFQEFPFGLTLTFHGRPLQKYFGTGVRHLCSEGKGVDPGYLAKDWVVANITKTAAFREGTGDCADDKLRFIHSRIIGTDIAVCLIQRTVHDDGIRVRDRRPEARILQPG